MRRTEGILGPLAECGKTWAQFGRLVMNAGRDPAAEGSRGPGLAGGYLASPGDGKGLGPGGAAGPGGVIHFSTATSVHSCVPAEQRVYPDHPQAYPQDATLAGPGLA